MAAKTYYGILVVLQRCSQSEIRRAYRRLSLLLHPDKNRGREKIAERKFKEVRLPFPKHQRRLTASDEKFVRDAQ